MLDFEAQTIKTNDVNGVQRKIRAHEQKRSPGRVYDCHEADELSGGTPQQVANAIAKHDIVLTVNRTESLLHRARIRKQRLELDVFPVALGSPSPPLAVRRFDGKVGNRVGSDPTNEVMTLVEQASDDLACGVVSIGDKIERRLDAHGVEQAKHF